MPNSITSSGSAPSIPQPAASGPRWYRVTGRGLLAALARLVRITVMVTLVVLVATAAYAFRAQIGETARVAVDNVSARLGLSPASKAPLAQPRLMGTITATDGQGVASRNGCSDDARLSGNGIPDGARVRVIEAGTAGCVGWSWVEWEQHRSWVRDRYLARDAR